MNGSGQILMRDKHILVIDDDDRLRVLLKNYLIKNRFTVTALASTLQAREVMKGFLFDLIVLDIMIPDEDGLSFLNSLRKYSQVPVLLLTAMAESDQRIKGLESGADDYLTKPFEPKELVLRIEAILRRSLAIQQKNTLDPIHFGDFILDTNQQRLTDLLGNPVHLTGVELMLISLLAKKEGQVISRAELAHIANIQGGDRAVDVQITRIRRKIGDNAKTPRYLCTVHGQGYVFKK